MAYKILTCYLHYSWLTYIYVGKYLWWEFIVTIFSRLLCRYKFLMVLVVLTQYITLTLQVPKPCILPDLKLKIVQIEIIYIFSNILFLDSLVLPEKKHQSYWVSNIDNLLYLLYLFIVLVFFMPSPFMLFRRTAN